MEESGTDEAVSCRKVASGQRVAYAILSLVNARGLQLECARVLYETLFTPVFMYSIETMIRTISEVPWLSGGWIKSLMHG